MKSAEEDRKWLPKFVFGNFKNLIDLNENWNLFISLDWNSVNANASSATGNTVDIFSLELFGSKGIREKI